MHPNASPRDLVHPKDVLYQLPSPPSRNFEIKIIKYAMPNIEFKKSSHQLSFAYHLLVTDTVSFFPIKILKKGTYLYQINTPQGL